MIRVEPLGSSSAGNAYLIDDGHTRLLLEAGIRYRDLQRALRFQLHSVAACLITHEHQDHCKSVREVMRAGIDVFASKGTFKALDLTDSHRAHEVPPLEPFALGSWKVMPFDVQHDVSEPYGYLMETKYGGKLVFLSDTYYCKYRFVNLTHILIETNYSKDVLDANVREGRVAHDLRGRILRSHMSLETAKAFLQANDLSQVQEIWLLHLSDANADEARFLREIQALTGKQVIVAKR